MNLEEYRSAWLANRPDAPVRADLDSVISGMVRQEGRSRILLGLCAFNAVIAVLFTGYVLLFRKPEPWNEVVPAVGLQVLVAVVGVTLFRRQGARRRTLLSRTSSLREAAEMGLQNVIGQIRDMRLLLGLMSAVVPLLGISVYQLLGSGKMNARAAWSFVLLCALVLAVNGVVQWWKYRRKLVPQRRRFEQILGSLKEEV